MLCQNCAKQCPMQPLPSSQTERGKYRSSSGRQLRSLRKHPGDRGTLPGGCCCGASATAAQPSSSGASGLRRARTCSRWSCAGKAPIPASRPAVCLTTHIDTALAWDLQKGAEHSVLASTCLNAALLQVASPSEHTTKVREASSSPECPSVGGCLQRSVQWAQS